MWAGRCRYRKAWRISDLIQALLEVRPSRFVHQECIQTITLPITPHSPGNRTLRALSLSFTKVSVRALLAPIKQRRHRDPDMARLAYAGDLLTVLITQLQLQRRKVLLHPLRLLGRVEHYDPLVQLPADQHRALAHAVLARELPERAREVQILEPRDRCQAHVALARDALGLQPPGVLGSTLSVRVELDLVHRGLYLGRLEQVLDVVPAEVGDADRLGLS